MRQEFSARSTISATPDYPAESDDPVDMLAKSAAGGDRVAAGKLLAIIQPEIVRYCRARIGRSVSTFAAADDVAQEACIGLLVTLAKRGNGQGNFRALAFKIASYKIIDFYRQHKRHPSDLFDERPEVADHTDGPEARALDAEVGGALRLLLSGLPETQRQILTLRLIVGLSSEETAKVLGSTPGNVRVMQHRALAKLRTRLTADPTLSRLLGRYRRHPEAG